MLITIIIFVVVLSLMVFVHELGHFTMARKFKVRVDEFGLGLPPRMLGLRWNKQERLEKIAEKEEITVSVSETESVITDKIQEVDQLVETKKREWIWGNKKNSGEGGGTIYSLNWIPVGGFVTMVGENGGNANNPESFSSKKIWQRAVILVAGVTMNMILCMILLSLGFFIGMPQVVGPETKGNVTETKIQVLEVVKDLPAAQSGIQAGDALVSIDNQSFKSIDDLRSYFAVRKDQSVAIKIKRNNEELEKQVLVKEFEGNVGIGVGLAEVAIVKYPFFLAIYEGVKTTFVWIGLIVAAFATVLKNLIVGDPIGAEVAGPVGIAVLTGQAARMGLVYLLQFTALLSLNLAIINIIPFPALDGGRLLFLLIEKIRGKVMDQRWENTANNVGFMLLMLLIILVTFKDVWKYGGALVNVFRGMVGI